ncbi:GRIP/coiled-coil protein [Tasmannia lanceolata]|uniref:GRIP/coiled-coil protein n=1 Tax=Tasmannia lanceolata TaxID=3420 RepID=UPI00406313C7
MALALNISSPTQLSKASSPRPSQLQSSTISMDSLPLLSPSSDKRFWSAFRSRVDAILEDRKRKIVSSGIGELESETRFREDSLLLLRGFDSIDSSLSQLADNLEAAQQGASDLARPSLTELLHRDTEREEDEEDMQPRAKKQCGSQELSFTNEVSIQNENKESPTGIVKNEKMKKAQNLAVSMATKAASLARELKTIKSDLCFMQERCTLLEEENRRLRDGFAKGVRPEEDELVRLQLEALLAEKSRLANENANLTRENQCLHQLVEYHQLTSQDLSASYEQSIRGMCLDFSSPPMENPTNEDYCYDGGDIDAPLTPRADIFGLSPVDEYDEELEP